MASYNQAMKTIAVLTGIRNSEYGELFARVTGAEPYSKSKIKAWFCGFHDPKYRLADASVFENFCKGAYLHLNEVSELPSNLVTETKLERLIEACFSDRVPALPLLAVRELVRVGTEDPVADASVYSRQLHILCQGYVHAEALSKGFDTTREVANQRFSGLIWACCQFSRRVENPVFNSDTFDSLCELADRDLCAHGVVQTDA